MILSFKSVFSELFLSCVYGRDEREDKIREGGRKGLGREKKGQREKIAAKEKGEKRRSEREEIEINKKVNLFEKIIFKKRKEKIKQSKKKKKIKKRK